LNIWLLRAVAAAEKRTQAAAARAGFVLLQGIPLLLDRQ
jgi:hypothetical protein